MGIEIDEKDNKYLHAVEKLSSLVASNILSVLHRIPFLYYFTPTKRAVDKYKKIINEFTSALIEERRKKILRQKDENQNIMNIDDEEFGLKKKMCLLDVLLTSTEDNKPLSNSDIQEEVNAFTFAGHDTTTTATCAILYLLSRHPEAQKKVNAEIHEILGDNELTFDSLAEFKYLEIVIKESLRMFPPVPIVSRRLHEECDFGDFVSPANINYNLPILYLMRNPAFFDNPDDFIPERFLKEMKPFMFQPFSAVSFCRFLLKKCFFERYFFLNI